MTYRPYPGSFANDVVNFFLSNPDEELTTEDMTIKWPSTPKKNVRTLLVSAVEAQALIRTRTPEGSFVYSPGPNLKSRVLEERPLSSYALSAGIHPKDPPDIVIRKLQTAISASRKAIP